MKGPECWPQLFSEGAAKALETYQDAAEFAFEVRQPVVTTHAGAQYRSPRAFVGRLRLQGLLLRRLSSPEPALAGIYKAWKLPTSKPSVWWISCHFLAPNPEEVFMRNESQAFLLLSGGLAAMSKVRLQSRDFCSSFAVETYASSGISPPLVPHFHENMSSIYDRTLRGFWHVLAD